MLSVFLKILVLILSTPSNCLSSTFRYKIFISELNWKCEMETKSKSIKYAKSRN